MLSVIALKCIIITHLEIARDNASCGRRGPRVHTVRQLRSSRKIVERAPVGVIDIVRRLATWRTWNVPSGEERRAAHKRRYFRESLTWLAARLCFVNSTHRQSPTEFTPSCTSAVGMRA